ncbi:MAG: guanylate kinase [Candidatus Komeilibacteria bacterium]|jgi:guanylate kinase|nr:guanylate kinase [Candidatus Komeilibacteria bacterium]MBT4447605.1 guanylate kinase [Candidatus Komeilibacteria bacterium]
MKSEKIIAIITGPSAVGKSTIAKEVLKRLKNFKPSTTYTTRPKRKEAEDKIMYNISEAEFKEKIDNNEFIEWAHFYGNFYGSDKKAVEEGLKTNNILMNIDVEGATIIKKKIDNNVSIFILPGSIKKIKERMDKRNMPEPMKKLRLKRAKEEIDQASNFDHQIINYDGKLEQTVDKVVKILERY